MKDKLIEIVSDDDAPYVYVRDENGKELTRVSHDDSLEDCMEKVAKAICRHANIQLIAFWEMTELEILKKYSEYLEYSSPEVTLEGRDIKVWLDIEDEFTINQYALFTDINVQYMRVGVKEISYERWVDTNYADWMKWG